MSHNGFEQPWLSAGPLIEQDWLSMPELVTRWWSNPTFALPVGGYRGGTQPLIPDPPPVQVPTVVPGPRPSFTNTQPPPLIPAGIPDLPPGGVVQEQVEGEAPVALEDWFQTGVDLANVWGRTRVSTPVQGPSQYVSSTPQPTILAPAPGQMGDNGYWTPTPKRRRRRRPCITQTDLGLAHQIAGLPNNANVRMFLAKCVH